MDIILPIYPISGGIRMNDENSGSLTMTYSSLLQRDGRKAICVRFERSRDNKIDFAEAMLPNSGIIKQSGFSKEEIAQLELYLRANRDEILSHAKQITGLMHWFK